MITDILAKIHYLIYIFGGLPLVQPSVKILAG